MDFNIWSFTDTVKFRESLFTKSEIFCSHFISGFPLSTSTQNRFSTISLYGVVSLSLKFLSSAVISIQYSPSSFGRSNLKSREVVLFAGEDFCSSQTSVLPVWESKIFTNTSFTPSSSVTVPFIEAFAYWQSKEFSDTVIFPISSIVLFAFLSCTTGLSEFWSTM